MTRERTWVESAIDRELTDVQRECVELLCEAFNTGPYNIRCAWHRAHWMDRGVILNVQHGIWATYDTDALTRLVIAAHDRHMRVELTAIAPFVMKVGLHKRARDGERIYQRHPTIEDAISRFRG